MSLKWENIFVDSEQNKNLLEDNNYVTFFNKLKNISKKFGYTKTNKAYNNLIERINFLEKELKIKKEKLNSLKQEFNKQKKNNQNLKDEISREKKKLERILESK